MPDARETLKGLAKSRRHKGLEIKVPTEQSRPVSPKKIKRNGPTRPYHQQIAEPADYVDAVDHEEKLAKKSANFESDARAHDEKRKLEDHPSANSAPAKSLVGALRAADPEPTRANAAMSVEKNTLEIQQSTDHRKADNKLAKNRDTEYQEAEIRKAESRAIDNATAVQAAVPVVVAKAVASEPLTATEFAPEPVATEVQRRSGGITVTNLAKRTLILPDWTADFSRDESFLRGFFRQLFGNGKNMKEVDLYCQLYSLAQQQNSISLHFLSVEIGGLVGSSSNGTIRTRLLTCEQLGLFVQQGFNNATASHRRGTYIHLKFPWFDDKLI